jgi:RNA polymerase sigma-70 factor (ECF subfamily)
VIWRDSDRQLDSVFLPDRGKGGIVPVTSGRIEAEALGIERRGEGVTSLLGTARQGQNEALGLALEACRAYLLALARNGLNRDLAVKVSASDLVQETFLHAQRQFVDFRGKTEEEWRSWLRRIIRNLLLETARRYASDGRSVFREVAFMRGGLPMRQDWQMADQPDSPYDGLIRQERVHALLSAITGLPERYSKVVVWHYREGATFEEIADRLGTTAEAARKLWVRALVRLRDALGPSHDPR